MSKISISGERLHQIIIAPVVSEKSTRAAEKSNRAVFKVLRDARKPEIKAAVEKMFNVKVQSVHTLNVKGKSKRFGASSGVRSSWKKAYVKLPEGQEIDFLSGASN
jgi:large subunit ribosomal protein L23